MRVVDHYLGLPATDWAPAFKARAEERRQEKAAAESRQSATRIAHTNHSLSRARYAGVYRDAWYGTVTIVEDGEHLVLRMDHTPRAVGDLGHWHHDTFKILWRDSLMADAFATFSLDRKGEVDHFTMAAVSPAADFSFDYHDLHFIPERAEVPKGR
jgi:hypothetical protein